MSEPASAPDVPPKRPVPAAPSLRAARFVRRAMLPFAIVCGVVLWWCFGVLRVPQGMDTTPEAPPGSVCIIDKRQGSAQPGKLAFVDLPAGGTLLSRITARDERGLLTLTNDRAQSQLPDSRTLGPLPVARVRGTVLVVLLPEAAAELPRAK